MPDFKIFTESKADIKFLSDYIEAIHGLKLANDDFGALGGRTGYKANGELNAFIRKNVDNQKQTILIADSDDDFNKNRAEILDDFRHYNIPVSLFLFPNDSSNGNLEDALTEIAVDRKLMGCFLEYEKMYFHLP